MHGWVKYFADGTKEIGTDYDTRMKKASWSRGRLEYMIGAEVIHGNKRLAIFMPGEFWQSDDYDCNIFEPTPSLVVRRLQKKIVLGDRLSQFDLSNDHLIFRGTGHLYPVDLVDEAWLTLEYDIKNDKFTYSIQENRI